MQGVNGIEITDVKLKKVNSAGKMIGDVSITLNDCLVIHNIKIIKTEEKRIIAFPSRKVADGSFKDITHPINSELRNYVEKVILDLYDKDED